MDELMRGEAMKTDFMQKVLSLALLGVAIGSPKLQGSTLTAHIGGHGQTPYVQTGIDSKYSDITSFLSIIKATKPVPRRFNVKDAPDWSIDRLMECISKNGVVLENVNTKKKKAVSYKEAEASLRKRKGDLFRALAHVSYLYSQARKQYSELRFVEQSNCVLVTLASWYEFDFAMESGRLKLRKCKYVNEDAD